jgi:predicted alpha/beta-fold hydrolase
MHASGFRPAWWLPGRHAQTLGARLLRSRARGPGLRRQRVALPDGDFLDLDATGGSPDAPLVLVLHGLEGSARSGYARQIYLALAGHRIEAVGVNFRSCSGEPNRTPRLYHSGETGDLRFVLDWLKHRFPERPLGAVGFSLGGNILLKYLGEEGTAASLAAAAAISVPFDLAAGARRLEHGFSRVYRRYLVGKLKGKTMAKAALLDGRVNLQRIRCSRTFVEFDDAATAPLHGFTSAQDYYARSSSNQYLASIRVPTLLIHSRDDPFLPEEAIPHNAVAANPFLVGNFTPRGGHVGFVSGTPWAPEFWAEGRAAAFVAGYIAPT